MKPLVEIFGLKNIFLNFPEIPELGTEIIDSHSVKSPASGIELAMEDLWQTTKGTRAGLLWGFLNMNF